MKFSYITAGEIHEFAKSEFADDHHSIPVTPWRALCQFKNPYAKKDDVLLIVAKDEGGNLTGYIGILPFPHPVDPERRIFFNTCWWAAPQAGSAVSMTLFLKFLKIVDSNVLFSDLTDRTAEILDKAGDFEVSSHEGLVIRLKSALDLRLRSGRNNKLVLRIFRKLYLFYLFDWIRNIQQLRSISVYLRQESSPAKTKVYESLEEKHQRFIQGHSEEYMTIPEKEQFDWWKNYPWLVSKTPENAAAGERYYFSSFAQENRLFVLEITMGTEIIGIAILRVRDGVVKTNYLFYDKEQEDLYFRSLAYFLISEKSHHTLITFHEAFVDYLNNNDLPCLSRKKSTRFIAYSKVLLKEIKGRHKLQDGDGDYVFT